MIMVSTKSFTSLITMNITSVSERFDLDEFDKEEEDYYNKKKILDSELTKLNGGISLPLAQPPCSHSAFTYALGDGVSFHILPEHEKDTFYISLSGTSEAINRNREIFKDICGDGRDKTPQEVYKAYERMYEHTLDAQGAYIKCLVDELFESYVDSVRRHGSVTNDTATGREISRLVFLAELFCRNKGVHPGNQK